MSAKPNPKPASQPPAAPPAPATDPAAEHTVTLTVAQWDVVAQCLDLGVRQGGVKSAEAILPVFRSINDQLQPNNQPS